MKTPQKQGLYDPQYEHDSCGIGMVVNFKGKRSHQIVSDAIQALKNLNHRGACGCEENTGDGAGVLFQLPHTFFKQEAQKLNFKLPELGHYGVGFVYLPQEKADREKCEKKLEEIIKAEGQTVLAWRDVPTNNTNLGFTAKAGEPVSRQIFVAKNPALKDDLAFERKLYVIRKLAENALRSHLNSDGHASFYVVSMSCRTIVYKGMLLSTQVDDYFPDLNDPTVDSAIALVHSRFSTNTFPNWERAHPYRYIVHNGEINTLRGNINWMHARQALLESSLFGDDIKKIMPIIDTEGSDSAMFDNCLELLFLGGRSLAHSMMMMIPEPWVYQKNMSPEKKAFYEFHAALMEPWDGPASIAFTDGSYVGAILDRNGLRPSRYYVTKDDRVILASEAGVLDIPDDQILYKGRLQPGRMLLLDTVAGRIIEDEEIKHMVASQQPYEKWLKDNLVELESLPQASEIIEPDHKTVFQRQQAFGYTFEDLNILMKPMAENGVEAMGSMGNDTPLAVFSNKPQLLYNYFKQLFAQVTNPPIDAIREEYVTSAITSLGSEQNLLAPTAKSCQQIRLKSPVLSNEDMAKLKGIKQPGFKSVVIPTLYTVKNGGAALERALELVYLAADLAIEKEGINLIILSDRGMNADLAAIPALLAVSGLHHHLIRKGTRNRVGLIIESGEPREVHHFALLLGYGCGAVNPYLAFETLDDMIHAGILKNIDHPKAVKNYIKAVMKGITKVTSKMGISTIQSYRGAQIFEAVGLNAKLIDKYFTWTATRIEGIGIEEIAREVSVRHDQAFNVRQSEVKTLESGGQYQWRADGEKHMYSPEVIHKLQYATRTNNYEIYKQYAELLNNQDQTLQTLRGLLDIKFAEKPIPIEEVESVESICKRFKTGAMSYGSISKEAHESLAIAMNRIGGKSNTGEGGEDPARYTLEPNGDSKNSAIKQVASGRFGVTSNYLVHAQEIQIKMAQGAKPGEGGQLPGLKVYPWIAKVRLSTPGVGLISPPPHHDIYSIEDLAELIHDLKNSNVDARINVKLVSEVGVGTIAAGVAKAHADVVLISGYDGGTGASPQTSIKHAGLPWELGLAETHQTLVLNNLRSRIVVETDGQLKTGRDVVVAALLGAEEFGFATAPLVTLGCIMMRVCHLDTCPVGVATQNPTLRKNFSGDPAHTVNFMKFIAQDMRELMAKLGFRSINEMVGRVDKLEGRKAISHWKTKGVDISKLLHSPDVGPEVGRYCQIKQDHGIAASLDVQQLLKICEPAIQSGKKVKANLSVKNVNRVVGTITGSAVTRKYGLAGLPEDTIEINFDGTAGQSFGAFLPKGMTFQLVGDANDYFGKGLSGGKLIAMPPANISFIPEKNMIIGNVAFYGATMGESYIRGLAGERFCVRNSGVNAVVEGVGDNGCEYMTGGRVVVLGPTGLNFAAGMSGGVAYVLDEDNTFASRCNYEMVELLELKDEVQIAELKAMIQKHADYTNSSVALKILSQWQGMLSKFKVVMPKDYHRMLLSIQKVTAQGITGDAALMAAFEENKTDLARVGGS